MTTRRGTANRSATERLVRLVTAELKRRNLTGQEVAREARLPANTFSSLLRTGHRPILDRADAICRALGISMTIGVENGRRNTEPGDSGTGG